MSRKIGNTISVKQKLFYAIVGAVKTIINFLFRSHAELILGQLAEELTPVVHQQSPFGKLNFYCPGRIPIFRVKTLFTKEPETIAWIDTFTESDVFWDIGANIGIYSLYAALKKVKVVSFEPSPSNYYLLSRNIEINKMDNDISALCIAFNDDTKLDSFYMSDTNLGSALNNFGAALDWQGKPFSNKETTIKQAMLGYSIDDFVAQFNPLFPSHIKIDVDGNEDIIIKGASKTLADTRLKSLLVELDTSRTEYYSGVLKLIIDDAGFTLDKKEHSTMFDTGPFSNVYNHIFSRP
jgi:FkbM family methyltransferase